MKFSIIIPTYNRAKRIKNCLDSILFQSYKDFEIIIVDDSSKDNTEQILQSYTDTRIKYIKLFENSGGPNKPRNIGAKNAQGEWLVFLDSDDYLESNALYSMAEIVSTNNNICALFTSCYYDNGIKVAKDVRFNRIVTFREYLKGLIKWDYMPSIKKDIFLSSGGYFESIQGGESILWKKILKGNKAYFSDTITTIVNLESVNRLSILNQCFYRRVLKCHILDLQTHWKSYLLLYPMGLIKLFIKILYYKVKSRLM